MKFKCVNEMNHLSFDDSELLDFKIEERTIAFSFNGATVKAKNSQNGRFQDMYCGEIILQMKNAEIVRLVKEGMKYYDADGELLKEIPDVDIPVLERQMVLQRLSRGKVFTVVTDSVASGYAYEFGIDVPREEDDEEVDTFWLCITCDETKAMWERYCSPAEESQL